MFSPYKSSSSLSISSSSLFTIPALFLLLCSSLKYSIAKSMMSGGLSTR